METEVLYRRLAVRLLNRCNNAYIFTELAGPSGDKRGSEEVQLWMHNYFGTRTGKTIKFYQAAKGINFQVTDKCYVTHKFFLHHNDAFVCSRIRMTWCVRLGFGIGSISGLFGKLTAICSPGTCTGKRQQTQPCTSEMKTKTKIDVKIAKYVT